MAIRTQPNVTLQGPNGMEAEREEHLKPRSNTADADPVWVMR